MIVKNLPKTLLLIGFAIWSVRDRLPRFAGVLPPEKYVFLFAILLFVFATLWQNFTRKGKERDLRSLERSIARYDSFSPERQRETLSGILRNFIGAITILLGTAFVSLPLITVIIYLLGAGVVQDVTNNIKGSQFSLTMPPAALVRGYGILWGIVVGLVSHLLDQALWLSAMLSDERRAKAVAKWQNKAVKLKKKLN